MAHTRRPKQNDPEPQHTRSDWHALVESVRDHPAAYIAGAAFVAVVIIIVAVYQKVSETHIQAQNSALAGALSEEDITLRLDSLTKIAASPDVTDEAVYLLGETAFDAENYDEARKAFERVRDEFPQSQYVPTAVEGMADIEFEQGNHEAALKLYQEIRDRWPDSFAARRQLLNIGRTQEKLGHLPEAVAAYQEQVSAFAKSATASMAQQALDRLKEAHPELFPEEPAPAPVEDSSEAAAPAPDPTATPVEPAPEASMPAAPASPEAAPAEEAPTPDATTETAAPAADASTTPTESTPAQ